MRSRAPKHQPGRVPFLGRPRRNSIQAAHRQVGKYLVSSSTRLDDGGSYAASVAIRSGRGSMTHQRVLRFVTLFESHDAASDFAMAQAVAWIGERDAGHPAARAE